MQNFIVIDWAHFKPEHRKFLSNLIEILFVNHVRRKAMLHTRLIGFYTITRDRHQQMGPRALEPWELAWSGTTPRREACFLTTQCWEFSCFSVLPPISYQLFFLSCKTRVTTSEIACGVKTKVSSYEQLSWRLASHRAWYEYQSQRFPLSPIQFLGTVMHLGPLSVSFSESPQTMLSQS